MSTEQNDSIYTARSNLALIIRLHDGALYLPPQSPLLPTSGVAGLVEEDGELVLMTILPIRLRDIMLVKNCDYLAGSLLYFIRISTSI